MKTQTSLTPGRRQSRMFILSRNVDKKSIETVFLIAICRPTGNKWQSKILFLSIFDQRSSIVDYVFDCGLPGVSLEIISLVSFEHTENMFELMDKNSLTFLFAQKHCIYLDIGLY